MHRNLKITLSVMLGLIVFFMITTIVYMSKYYSLSHSLVDPAKATVEDVQKIVAEVGKTLDLPGDETPTMATVSDPSKLKDQPFFKNAQTGDVVLVYALAKKVILWRPATGKVIEVSSANVPAAPAGTTKK